MVSEMVGDKPNKRAIEQAAHWFAMLNAEQVSDQQRQQWQQWLRLDPSHGRAWQYVEQIDQQFNGLGAEPAHRALQAAVLGRRRLLTTIAGFAVLAPLAWLTLGGPMSVYLRADERTAIGEVKRLRLPDGTELWLNTRSAVAIHYRQQLREIQLLAGEIRIKTAPNPVPLQVRTEFGLIRPIGTEFSVRTLAQQVQVVVTQGQVASSPGNQPEQIGVIRAGQTGLLDKQQVQVQTSDAHQLIWRDNRLVADNIALDVFLEELARYQLGIIDCDPALAELRIVGVFPLGDIQQTLASLQATLPIRLHNITPWYIKVSKQ